MSQKENATKGKHHKRGKDGKRKEPGLALKRTDRIRGEVKRDFESSKWE